MATLGNAEIEIPVPWGNVSAKIWGDEKDTPILVIHGIMDNAGSFDHLIPLLPKPFYYICIDLPGHGLSSRFPAHIPINSLNYLIVYKLVMDYLNRKKYIVIGHSYGGQLGIVFTQLYPQYIEKLILLDTVTLLPILPSHFRKYFVDNFDNFLLLEEKLSKKNNPPNYTYEEAIDKLKFGRFAPITTEAAVALSHRGLLPIENARYRFRLDPRIKNSMNPERDFKYIIDTLRNDRINCPILIVLGRDSKLQQTYMRQVLSYFKKMKNIRIKVVAGHHDVHNDSPELVAPYITRFLLQKPGKL